MQNTDLRVREKADKSTRNEVELLEQTLINETKHSAASERESGQGKRKRGGRTKSTVCSDKSPLSV